MARASSSRTRASFRSSRARPSSITSRARIRRSPASRRCRGRARDRGVRSSQVIDATILIPTHRHARLLPFALRSALAQEDADDRGVRRRRRRRGRHARRPSSRSSRIRGPVLRPPKGRATGERLRHEALQDSSAARVCYLCDDDLLAPGHVRRLRAARARRSRHRPPAERLARRSIHYFAFDLARPEFVSSSPRAWGGGLTGNVAYA
jgi:hypothetical protein